MGGKGSGRKINSDSVLHFMGMPISEAVEVFKGAGVHVGYRSVYYWATGQRKPSKIYQNLINKIFGRPFTQG